MHVSRTSEIVLNMTFDTFYNELHELVNKHEKNNTPLKVEKDLDVNIVKIFGKNITALARAKNGLIDVTELAYANSRTPPILESTLQLFRNSQYHFRKMEK